MSKRIIPGPWSKMQVMGGRAGRAPGRGTSFSTTGPGGKIDVRPTKGSGSRKLGGRPPKGKGKP